MGKAGRLEMLVPALRIVVPVCSPAGGYGSSHVANRCIGVRHIPIGPATCIHH